MLKQRKQYKLERPVQVTPGDTLVVTVKDKKGTQDFREEIGRTMTVDTVVTFDAKDEFGLEDGVGAIFGKSKGKK